VCVCVCVFVCVEDRLGRASILMGLADAVLQMIVVMAFYQS